MNQAFKLGRRAIIALAVSFMAPLQAAPLAPEESAYLASGEATRLIVEPYFAAYMDRNWDRLETLLHDQATLHDPTAEQLFGTPPQTGKQTVMANLRKTYAGILDMRMNRTRAIFSSHYAVLEGTLDWTIRIGADKELRTPAMPFVVVLRVQDGKVIEHRDYADYSPFIEAFSQLRASLPKREKAG